MNFYKYNFNVFVISAFFLISACACAQNYQLVAVTGIVYGNGTNDALFKVTSSIPSLKFIRAQKIKGPQNGIFTQYNDNIRYTAISTESGIPANLSRIRFTFLQSDKITAIAPNNFRFIINDIDGPDNEALATNCDANLNFLGTASPTNLTVINLPPTIIAVGSVEESDGPTSRVMFEFNDVAVIEIDNYANDGYLKDFDMNNDYPITEPIFVKCKSYTSSIFTERASKSLIDSTEFKKDKNLLLIKTNPIYFDTDKYNIRKDAAIELEKIIKLLAKYPKLKIEIRAHTDSRADDNYNLKLSNNRAKSTINWMLNKGIDSARVSGKGFGETLLINNCKTGVKCTDKEHQLNRRIEFLVKNPEAIKQ